MKGDIMSTENYDDEWIEETDEEQTEEFIEDEDEVSEEIEDEESFYEYDGDIEKDITVANRRFERAQRDLNIYIESKSEPKTEPKPKKRKWYDISPNSTLSGKSFKERIGYNKEAHDNAYKRETFIDKHISSSNGRIIAYIILIILGITVFVLHQAGVIGFHH